MQSRRLTLALTVTAALLSVSWLRRLVRALGIAIASVALLSLTTSCSVSRKAVSEHSELKVESTETVEKVLARASEQVRADSVIVEQRDTLREVTTITIDRNDKGDTLKVVQITDRYRGRDMSDVRSKKEDVRIVRDTVYIERKDSVLVQEFKGSRVQGDKPSAFVTTLKWIFFIIIGLIGLIITVKVCLHR